MADKPNILLITADQMRRDMVGCNGNDFIRTPSLDGLAARGVTFTNAYSPNPICVPGRACITTGNYPHVCTEVKNNGGYIKDDQLKIAEHFTEAGYMTAAIGKLHYVPYAAPGQPRLLHGFEYCELCESGRVLAQHDPRGTLRGVEDYHDYLVDVGFGGYERAHGIGNNDVHASPSALPAEHHEEAWVAARSIAKLQEHFANNPEKPFFMWSSFAKPHSPYDPPEPYNRAYDPREIPPPIGSIDLLADRDPMLRSWPVAYGWDKLSPQGVQYSRAHYCGMVTFQDEMIGRLITFLRQVGQLDNTIIIYTADHGDLLGDFGCFFKCSMFAGSVGIPLIAAGPGITVQGPNSSLVGLQDVLPTLAELSSNPLSKQVAGHDLSPILAESTAMGREMYVSQCMDSPNQRYMVCTERHKYVYHELGGVEELYDLANDPQESRNMSADNRELTGEMRGALLDWVRDNGDEQMLDGDDLVVSPEDSNMQTEMQPKRLGWRWY